MKKLARLLMFIMALSVPLTSGFNVVNAQAKPKVLIAAAGPGDPRSIDPQKAIDTRDWSLENLLFPALTTLDEETNEVVPGLSKGWDVSADGLTTAFHLIENVPWVRYNATTGAVEQVKDKNGNPRIVTAQDIVFGWTRALDPATASPAAYMLAPLIVGGENFNAGKGAAKDVGLRAVDQFTFEVKAPESVGYALGLYGIINSRPAPQWAIEDGGDAWTQPENINTYGPFALKEWTHDDHLTFIKNPFWPGSKGYSQAKLDELVVRLLDGAVQLREYEAGNLDVVSIIPGDQFDRIKSDAVLSKELKIVPGACTNAWAFHTKKPPFDNVHIRRAFSYAVDRQSLVDNVIKGGVIPATWYTPPSVKLAPTPEANPNLGIKFDAKIAKDELALALKDLGLDSADKLPPITVVFGNSETNNAIGQALQIMWQSTLGIKVTLNPMDPTTYWSTMAKDAGQIHAQGWCPDYDDANNYTRDVMRSDSIYNYGRWNSPAFDKPVDDARKEHDDSKRKALYAQAEDLMVVKEAAVMPLAWSSVASLTKPTVTRTYASNGVESFWKWDIQK